MLKDTKETIISRMIKTASGLWGYSDSQDINSFDPVVSMIFAALAEELSKLNTDIKKTDARLSEKLFELLFSKHEFTHSAAHAIIRAKPQQARVGISEFNQFVYKLKIPKTLGNETVFENKDICFSPTGPINLFKAESRYILAANKLFEVNGRTKELLAESEMSPDINMSSLYVGFSIDHLVDKLDGLPLMFSMSNKLSEEKLFHVLNASRWKLNGTEIAFRRGIDAEQDDMDNSLNCLLRKENDISYNTCRFVNELYRPRFVTISKNNYLLRDFKMEHGAVQKLSVLFPEQVLKNIPLDTFWLEIEFSQPLRQELLSDISVTTNCFPVINRELNEFSHSLTKGVNVIPLSGNNLFLDMDRVSDSKGKIYKALDNNGADDPDNEGYYLRQGGIARFDSRDAVEMIQNLLDLVRDERAGFSVLGTDMIASELKQLEQIINRLQNRIDASSISREAGSYLLLQCQSEYERANIRFWSTNGEEANNIRPDSRLSLQRGGEIDGNSIVFVTNSLGGRQKLLGEQKMNKLRRLVLSRGRVVTREDIKILCFEEFGSDLERVEISKGSIIDPDPAKGFIRCIDIRLTLKKNVKPTADEQIQKAEALKVRLIQQSANLLPYRVLLNQ